jgi:hypothetical protein
MYERFFLPSLNTKRFELHAYTLDQEGSGEFLAEDFKNCIRFKLAKIIESIKINQGEIVVWSDVDIQFFGLQPDHILPYFQPAFDLAAQRLNYRSEDVCGGFYAVRCSPRTLDFFHQVNELTLNKTEGNEQDAINLALKMLVPEIRWRFFGGQFYARTHGIRIPVDAVLHHATGLVAGNAVSHKISLLKQLEHFERWGNIRRRLFVLQQLPASLRRKLLGAIRSFGPA